jgi:hypothetical protein
MPLRAEERRTLEPASAREPRSAPQRFLEQDARGEEEAVRAERMRTQLTGNPYMLVAGALGGVIFVA